jgi:hypothetical protein
MMALYPVWKLLFPKYVTTTECVGRSMLNVAKGGLLSLCLRTTTSTVFAGMDCDLRPWCGFIRPF